MLNEILNVSNKYAKGLEHVIRRRTQWLEKQTAVLARLKEIADHLNANSDYKQQYYVDKSHAFNEDIDGTCAQIPSITFRAGEMPMHVTFKNISGSSKEYFEEGFKIVFSPTITGQIIVLIFPHYSNMDPSQPNFQTMAVLNEPDQITNDIIDEIIMKGMEAAFYTSFTGIAEPRPGNGQPNNSQLNPIGFKRYETTQKGNQG